MATTKKYLIDFRSNTRFSINYETNKLSPELELILLSTEPKYELTKKGEVLKGNELSEFRIFTTLDGINAMIGQLQALAIQLQSFEQLSTGINTIIEANKANADRPKREPEETSK